MINIMNLKQNKYYLMFVVILFVGLALYIFNYSKQQAVVEPTIDTALVPVKKLLIEFGQNINAEKLSNDEILIKTNEILEKLPPEYKTLKHQYQVAMSTLPDITFYGRVIDQFDQPVSGARVWYEGTNTYLSAGGGRGQVETDEGGYFKIDTVGATLSLGDVAHPDVEYSHQLDSGMGLVISQKRLKAVKSFLSHDDNAGIYANWHDYTTKDNAYVIKAWRFGKYEGAIEGGVSAGLSADGKIYTLKLDEREIRDRVIEGKKEGFFHISCNRPHIDSYKDRFDWSFSLVIKNGGILETDDLFMNVAPEAGYQPSLNINMSNGADDYKSHIANKRYYFLTNNGRTYGSMLIDIKPFASIKEDFCSVRVRYKFNPTGSRNLELKRSNTSYIKPESPMRTTYASTNEI